METNNTSIQPSEFTNFLESGALLRASADTWFLLKGPFKIVDKVPPEQLALYQPDFFLSSNQNYWLPEAFYKLSDLQMRQICEDFDKNHELLEEPSLEWKEAKFQSFEDSFRIILKKFQNSPLKKAVPIVFEKSVTRIDSKRLLSMIKHLLSAPPELFIYGSWQEGRGVLGATPEVLLSQQGAVLKTMALAGTCPKQEKSRCSLMDDQKERHEHDLVVQDIQKVLKPYGSLTTTSPQILELPTLFHLKTDIECQVENISDFSFFEACKKLHPTPALGVSPRDYGYEWMRELPEQQNREGFGAPWGLKWGKTDALCLVAIRNLQWDNSGSRIGSGCGIVSQSEIQQEWRELSEKRQSVKKVLGLLS